MSAVVEIAYPLSPMQQGLLFHSLAAPGSGVYVAQVTARLPPEIDPAVLERAWQIVVERHGILRASFVWDGVEPLQRVQPDVTVHIDRPDWRDLDRGEIRARLARDRERGFDLASAPLMRFALCDLADGTRLLVWTHHHLLVDGRARVTLMKELAIVYDALAAGRDAGSPPAPQFERYIEWLQRQDASGAEEFWRDMLDGSHTSLPLTFTRGTAANAERAAAGRKEVPLSSALQAALRRTARDHDVTVNILIQGAWAILLGRYTGQESVVFGATRSCRRAGFDRIGNLVGVVMNTLPHRVRVDGRRPCAAVVADLRAQHVAMRPHEQTPLGKIREWSGVDGSVPLFDSVIVFEERDLDEALRADGRVLWRNGVQREVQTHYGITLSGYAKPSLRLELACHPDVCSAEVAERLRGHFVRLLEGIAADPQMPAGDLPMLAVREQQLFDTWNDTSTPVPNVLLPAVFEAQAGRTPSASAVVCGDVSLTYAELNQRANRLAHLLIGLGVGPEMPVAVAMPRSVDMVVALLATLKAGAVYLPLDPHLPPDRLAAILNAARPICLLSCMGVTVPAGPVARHVVVDSRDAASSLEQASAANPTDDDRRAALTPESLAYILFTSGSTGEPKGVAVSHRAIVNKVSTIARFLDLSAGTRFGATSAVGFDPLLDQILCPLAVGGACVIMPDSMRDDAARFGAYAKQHGITVLNGTPGFIQHVASTGDLRVDTLMVGGDVLTSGLAANLHAARAARRILNLYGPTETCINASAYDVPAAVPAAVPIGAPLPNYRLYVLDGRLNAVPIDITGDLYIAGSGLARGYVNRPALTAARFVPDPYGAPGARMYRTGDRARWREDGQLEFLGRADRQVKVQGVRIEPAEIERALDDHPAILQAVVSARAAASGERRLAAYIVARADATVSEEELRRFLVRKLPPSMIPDAFVFLPTIPLTPLAKVDFDALPPPEVSLGRVRGSRTPEEQMLCDLFAEMLGHERVEVDQNFFALGGHSLLATRLVSRIRTTLGYELAIGTLFEAPTVRALAGRLQETTAARPPIVPTIRSAELPASYAQRRLWFLDRLHGRSSEYHTCSAWRVRGPLDVVALTRAVQAIVARHESLRTHFVEVDGDIRQAIQPVLHLEVPIDDLSALGEDARREAVVAALCDAREQRFDLSRGPLIRLRLLRLGPADHVLVHVVHHIVSDAWSRAVFNRELMALYGAFDQARPDPLPPLPVQYADFALWQRRHLDDAGLARELDYWRQQLKGIPDRLDLPADHPRPPIQTFDAALCVAVVPPERSAAVKRLAQGEHATPYMVLLTAFAVLLARYAGQDDVLVGSPIANRRDASLEDLIGIFINSLVLRVRVGRGLSFRDLLAQVRNTALEAYKHQEMPFERLVEELAPHRTLSTSPIVQVLLVVQNAPEQPLALSGLIVEPVPDEAYRVRYDIEVHVRETMGQLAVSWVYNRDLFDRWRIEQMARHFVRALEAMTEAPNDSLDDFDLLTDDERLQITRVRNVWNGGVAPFAGRDGSAGAAPRELARVDAAFEEWVQRTPEALAVLGAGQCLTYRELNHRATCLADRLRALGAGPGAIVGIAMRRSPWMVVGLLAVLKTGAAYLPLDQALPRVRLKFVVHDAGIALLLTDPQTRASVEDCGARLVDAETRELGVALPDDARRGAVRDLDDRAYVLYTSGSTGVPKGVAVSHRSLANIMSDLRERLGVTAASRAFALTNIAFDIAATELWLPLTSGASCWVASATLAAGEPVVRELTGSRCSILQATPSGWRALLDQGWRGDGRLTALCAGEPLHGPLAQELLRTCASVWNLYGPTETAIYSTAHRVEVIEDAVPIGRPVANTQTFVLDRHMRLVPRGVSGELFIGGEGVAIGYMNRPELTAGAFVPDPFAGVPGRRLYRTGDVVRARSDGTLEFVGRRDHQVKVRGFRIELEDIEAAIAAQPGIRTCVVTARKAVPGDVRLTAYVVPDGDLPESPRARGDELKRLIRERLPEYMVPSAVIWMAALPLTPSGKVDRQALPAPSVEPEQPAEPPQTAVERAVVDIWREVIGCAEVGRDDDFFELGGHSLTAIKVTARVWRDLGVELPLQVVFERPVLADMAAYIATCVRDQSLTESA